MTITGSRFLEDCFDGTIIREISFESEIDEKFILYLGGFGEMQYFPDFPRPFFIIEESGKYTIKGSAGRKTARIILSKSLQEESYTHFVNRCTGFLSNSE